MVEKKNIRAASISIFAIAIIALVASVVILGVNYNGIGDKNKKDFPLEEKIFFKPFTNNNPVNICTKFCPSNEYVYLCKSKSCSVSIDARFSSLAGVKFIGWTEGNPNSLNSGLQTGVTLSENTTIIAMGIKDEKYVEDKLIVIFG